MSSELPDTSYAELVTLLLCGRLPMAVMVLTVVVVGSLAHFQRPDALVLWLCGSIIILLILRGIIVTSFMRDGKTTPIPVEAIRLWEIRYVRIVLPYAALLGFFNFHLITTGSPAIRLLVVAETFGFCSGILSRSFVRPQLCGLMVLMGSLPTATGFVILAVGAGGSAGMVYAVVGGLFALYAFASLETINHLYGAMLDQLVTKRELGAFARVDPLTGLANRLAMREKLVTEENRKEGPHFALLLIDLDGFKSVNDRFGHPAGDRLLREVGERLTAAMRENDLAVRLGGDEFCVIQTGLTTIADAKALATRLIEALAEPFLDRGETIRIGSSIGIAMEDGSVRDIDQLVFRADSALYRAKRLGGDTLRFWRSSTLNRVK